MKKTTKVTYIAHRVLISLILAISIAGSIINKDWSVKSTYIFNAAQAAAFLATTFIPNILKRLHFEINDVIYFIFILFMSAHFLLGEIFGFFAIVPWWDSALHTFSGVLLTFISFSLISLMNESGNKNFKLNIYFTVLFAFALTLTIGAIWEIVEFSIDSWFGTNMQRAYESLVDGSRGTALVGQSALADTMKDLILDASGSLVTCVVCVILYKTRNFDVGSISLIRINKTKKEETNQDNQESLAQSENSTDEVKEENVLEEKEEIVEVEKETPPRKNASKKTNAKSSKTKNTKSKTSKNSQ